MAVTLGNFVTSPIPNTTLRETLRNGVLFQYRVIPDNGYALHDNESDYYSAILDEFGDPTGETILKLGFTTMFVSCEANYDFDANPREFYTKPIDELGDNEIILGGGTGNNDHEVM